MSTSELPRINGPVWSTGFPGLHPAFEPRSNDSPLWTAVAPKKVVGHSRTSTDERTWRAWRKYLARRKSPLAGTAAQSLGVAELLGWGVSLDIPYSDQLAALASTHAANGAPSDARQQALDGVLGEFADIGDESKGLTYLGCAYALPKLSQNVSEELWWRLLGRLYQTALDAAALDVSARPLLHQWLAGELALVLATLFPELAPCAQLLAQARRALSIGLEELLDGEGMPHWRHLASGQALVACWTRAQILAEALGGACWDEEAQLQYPLAVRELLRGAMRDGGSLFAGGSLDSDGEAAARRFLATAVQLSNDRKNRAALRRSGFKPTHREKNAGGKHTPHPANHSEWAQAAVLRADWRRSSPRLGVTYGARRVRGELLFGDTRWFTGDWTFTSRVDGTEATAEGDWEEVCWVSDDDVDYLELEIHLSEGLRLQRQICLARNDRFLFVADALLGGRQRAMDHTLRLPLGPAVTCESNEESREIMLRGEKRHGMLLPLALPEWRVDPRGGALAADARAIELRQTRSGEGLYAALWIDLDGKRVQKPFTWRQLTVADERQIVPRDQADGYRIQFGKQQWLVYRSLTPARNRSLLGHNLSTEFLIARFGRDGSVTPLIEVE